MGKFRSDYSQYLLKPVDKRVKPQQVPVAISLNGSLLSVTGFLQDGVSLLPVRAVTNAVGGKGGVDSGYPRCACKWRGLKRENCIRFRVCSIP
ncbi:hypothetical protein [Brevibacillus sp. MS2.2]|uniref:hypothetical protein n=1 Tax=Brevibacillus sp. MS2.2 TaxID=2738981 RepID=UPI0020C5218C|nr:hypothetical protein [Brevibacillus sp. MS2.2]